MSATLAKPKKAKMVLALDLGTKTGWSIGKENRPAAHGTWDLKPTRFSGGGMRYVRFQNYLEELWDAFYYDVVVFEEVRRHKGTDAAHVYGGLMATLQARMERSQIPYEAVPVGVIKKFWTKNGNASKDLMVAEAEKRGFTVADDNEADAIALFSYWQEVGAKG
jgi:crossover junction endodeoxyribonuclease RuvC